MTSPIKSKSNISGTIKLSSIIMILILSLSYLLLTINPTSAENSSSTLTTITYTKVTVTRVEFPTPPDKIWYELTLDGIKAYYAWSTNTFGMVYIKVIDANKGILSISFQAFSGSFKVELYPDSSTHACYEHTWDEVLYLWGTLVYPYTKTDYRKITCKADEYKLVINGWFNKATYEIARGGLPSGYNQSGGPGIIYFTTKPIPKISTEELYPQAIMGTEITFNTTLGTDMPFIYTGPIANLDKQYVTAMQLEVNKVVLPPAIYDLLPLYAQKGEISAMLDYGFYYEPCYGVSAGAIYCPAKWERPPQWQTGESLQEVTINGKLSVGYSLLVPYAMRFVFPFGTAYTAPLVKEVKLDELNNLTLVINFEPDTSFMGVPPWIAEQLSLGDVLEISGQAIVILSPWITTYGQKVLSEMKASTEAGEAITTTKPWLVKGEQLPYKIKAIFKPGEREAAESLVSQFNRKLRVELYKLRIEGQNELNDRIGFYYKYFIQGQKLTLEERNAAIQEINRITEQVNKEIAQKLNSKIVEIEKDIWASSGKIIYFHVIPDNPITLAVDILPTMFDVVTSNGVGAVSTAIGKVILIFYGMAAAQNVAWWLSEGRSEQDPAGVAYSSIVYYIVEDDAGTKYLVYFGAAPKISFGIWLGGLTEKPAKDYTAMIISDLAKQMNPNMVPRGIIKEYDVKEGTLTPADMNEEIASWISTFTEKTVSEYIADIVGKPASQLTLKYVGFVSAYMPYDRYYITHVWKDVLDFSLTERGVEMHLFGVSGKYEEITDPNKIIDLLGPVNVNDLIFKDWTIVDDKATLTAQVKELGTGSSPPKIKVSLHEPKTTLIADVTVTVNHFFIWNLLNGSFGFPCIEGQSKFVGLFKITSLELFYVLGETPTSPPQKIFISFPNATTEIPENVPYSSYFSFIFGKTSTLLEISGDAFYWEVVGNETRGAFKNYPEGTVWYRWRGIAVEDRLNQLPILRFMVACGTAIVIRIPGSPEFEEYGEKYITGEIKLNGGTSPTPVKAEFIFYTNGEPSTAWANIIIVIGVYYLDTTGAEVWLYREETPFKITSWPVTYNGLPAFKHTIDIQEITGKAFEYARKLSQTMYISAMAIIRDVPPEYIARQPTPAIVPITPTTPLESYILSVRVVDAETTLPIESALVLVVNKTHTFEGTTDADGFANFTLSPGGYEVSASRSGYQSSQPTLVELQTDKTIVIPLIPITPSNASLTVIVTDGETGRAIQGAVVKVKNSTLTLSQSTDATGKAIFILTKGGYIVHVSKEGYSPHEQKINLAQDTTLPVSLFPLIENVSATVDVYDSSTNRPIQGATVVFENGTMVYSGVTNSQGRTVITLPKGGYNLRITASGYYSLSETIYLPYDVSIIRYLTPVETTVNPPIPPTPPEQCPVPLTTIHVNDIGSGVAISGASIVLARGPYQYTSTTDSNGNAKLCITNGVYSFSISHPNYQTKEGSSFFTAGKTYNFELVPISSIPSAWLTVIVYDSHTNERIKDAKVEIRNATTHLFKYTDNNGEAKFLLTGGGYSIKVTKDCTGGGVCYYPFESEFRFPATSDSTYQVGLNPMPNTWIPTGSNWTEPAPTGKVWLAVNVRYSDGAPFAGAEVKIYSGQNFNNLIYSGQTDGEGYYKVLLDYNGQYKLNVTAIHRGEKWSVEYVFTASASYWLIFYTPWYSGIVAPEVMPLYVGFIDRYGIWGQDHLITFSLMSNVKQPVTVRIEAINYTALIYRNVEQVLSYKDVSLTLSEGITTSWVSLKINGDGWALVAPRLRIITYRNDTNTSNNVKYGEAIQFGPYLDIQLSLYIFLKEWVVPANYPEMTVYGIGMKIISGKNVPIPGQLFMNTSYVSALNNKLIIDKQEYAPAIRAGINWQNTTLRLPWTNITTISALLKHPYDVVPQNNYATYQLELDTAIKILNITVPGMVIAGKPFPVKIYVLSNKYQRFTVSINMTGSMNVTYVNVPFGISSIDTTGRAYPLKWYEPAKTAMFEATVGPDVYMEDNTYTSSILIVNPTFIGAIIAISAVAMAGIGIFAVYKSSKKTMSLYTRRRRVIRHDEYNHYYDAYSLTIGDEIHEEKKRRRVLRES